MDLKVQIQAEADCQSIFLFETTGSYQECCNDGGYGHPNILVTDITSSRVVVKGPTMKEPVTLDVTGMLPSDSNHGIEILPSELGLEKIDSGVYQLELIHTIEDSEGGVEEFNSKCYILAYECLRCCLAKGIDSIGLDNIDTPESKRAYRANRLFQIMLYAGKHGQWKKADRIAEYLRHQCDCCF